MSIHVSCIVVGETTCTLDRVNGLMCSNRLGARVKGMLNAKSVPFESLELYSPNSYVDELVAKSQCHCHVVPTKSPEGSIIMILGDVEKKQ